MEFRVPELGEGIEQATVVRVMVSPGTTVAEGQDIVELETDKATMPVPAPAAGTVGQVQVKPGDKVRIGSVLMTTTDGAAGGSNGAKQAAPAKAEAAKPAAAKP